MTTTQDPVRRRDPQRTREDILRIATAEFAANGYAGARVDEIAKLTRTTKRMIYYYFDSKEGLYLAVMEEAYATIRKEEVAIDVSGLSPVEALRVLAESTYDHHTSHRDFVRLVQIENVHRAEHMQGSAVIRDLNSTAVQLLEQILERGVADGSLRGDIDAIDVHMIISSYAFFHVANRYTMRTLFNRDLLDDHRHSYYRKLAGEIIVATMAT